MMRAFNNNVSKKMAAKRFPQLAFLAVGTAVLSGTGFSAFATVADVGQYIAGKSAFYVQTGNSTPTLATSNPYQFQAQIDNGTTGSVLTTSTLTLPAGATGTVTFASDGSGTGIRYKQYFASQSALNAAFPDGNYTFGINTSTPNTYNATLDLTGVTYPSDIPTITGGTWSGGNLVIDPTVDNTISWNASNDLHLSFGLNNTNIDESVFNSGSGLPSSYTIAANTLLPGQSYSAQLDFANGIVDTTQISGVTGAVYYDNSTLFTVVTTPEPAAGVLLLMGVFGMALLVRRPANA
jgi:hypothetical protein